LEIYVLLIFQCLQGATKLDGFDFMVRTLVAIYFRLF